MKTFKIYYINLDKSTDRKIFMENQFKKLNIPITRIPAIYGKELNKTKLKKEKASHNILAHFPLPNDGEIGICLTHFKLWKFLSEQPEDFSIILEDDALINSEFFEDLPQLLLQITANDFLDISGKKGFYSLEKTMLLNKDWTSYWKKCSQKISDQFVKILCSYRCYEARRLQAQGSIVFYK